MIETLLVYAYLIDSDSINKSEYEEDLNEIYEKTPNNDLLLELEWCTNDLQKSKEIIFDYYFNNREIDYNVFGCFLMKKLKNLLSQKDMCIEEFCSRIYNIWSNLPNDIMQEEPFWAMSYADEPLSWGDTQQTYSICGKMFDFYSKSKLE